MTCLLWLLSTASKNVCGGELQELMTDDSDFMVVFEL